MLNIKTVAQAKGIVPPPGADGSYGLPEFYQLIANIMDFLLTISIPVAIAVIVYGGFKMMTSGGSEQKIKDGKQAILAAVVGLAIAFGSFIIIKLIGRAIGYNFNL